MKYKVLITAVMEAGDEGGVHMRCFVNSLMEGELIEEKPPRISSYDSSTYRLFNLAYYRNKQDFDNKAKHFLYK